MSGLLGVLEATFNATPLPIAHLDLELRFVAVNAAWVATHGKTQAFYVGMSHFVLFPHPENERLFEQVRQTGTALTMRAQARADARDPGRDVTHWDWALTPVKDGAGAVTGLVLTLCDVSDRVRALLALARNEERLEDAQRIAQTGSWELDLQRNHLTASEAMYEMFELDGPAREFQQRFGEVVVEEDRAALTASLEACIEHHAPVEFQHRIQRRDGAIRSINVRLRYVDDERGRRLMGTSQDVTERERAARELRVKEAAIQSSLNGVAMASLDGVVTYVNPAFLRLWGMEKPEDIVGRPVTSLWDEPAAVALLFFEHLLARGAWFGRRTARTRHGTRTLQMSAHLVRDGQGAPLCVMASFVDVTEQELVEKRLAAELREKETLLREVHHRVKNNLQVISSLLSLQAAQSTNEGVRSALAESGARVQTMAMVHERLYRSARLSSLELGAHLSELAKMVFEASSPPGVTLDCAVDSAEVDVDLAIPLGLILNELVSNACKHAFRERGRGRVSVRLRRLDSRLELCVTDDGRGLPAGFDVERSGSLGLRIVKTLVRQLRATLSVEQPGGTCVKVVTPHPAEDRA